MAFTSDDLTAIENAIKSGTLKVKYADREVEYRSLKDLKEIRDMIRAGLGETSSGRKRYKAQTSKGLTDASEDE